MRKNLLLVFLFVVSILSNAQTTITNGNMENWGGSGASIEPTQWNSTKSAGGAFGGFAPQTLWQDPSTLNGGQSCAKLVTGNALGNTVNGAMTTGRIMVPSTNASEGYIGTITTDPNYRMAFTGRPDSLVFWYKASPVGVDYPSVEARIHINDCYNPETPVNNNHPNAVANIVARATWQGTSTAVGTWTRVAVPFVYVNSTVPQYILITSTPSGNLSSPQQGSTLWLDEFSVVYNPTIVVGTVSPLAYYVSSSTGTAIDVPYTITGTFTAGNTFTAQLSDASGNFGSPVTLGSVTNTASGTINGIIPAGTASGTGYRVRVVSSNPSITSAANANDISITLVSNSIAPATAQVIPVNTNGTTLTVTETATAASREWKYSSISGTGYQSFGSPETGTTYVPYFSSTGTYYVVCVTTYTGGVTVTSNEVMITSVGNSIAPATSQSILVGVNGTQLTVTESPAGMWREWKYSTTSGTNYQSFAPSVTGATTYTPNFASAGTYYVVCYSEINGVFIYSNEVQVNVGSATITTTNPGGFPYHVSPNASDLAVNVGYTTSGTFNAGNVFTAQLSDASGSFASPVNIGSVASTTSGFVSSVVPHTTVGGLGYRVRVVSDNPNVIGADNGVDLQVIEFTSNVTPTAVQTIPRLTNGTALSVNATHSFTAQWQYNTLGAGYVGFATPETGQTYTPYFDIPGTYFVRCIAYNSFGDSAISNEVQIDVTNGTTLTTAAISGSPFSISLNMGAPVDVNYSSDALFYPGNEFKVQLSDFTGSFANPVEIASVASTSFFTINAAIPGNTPGSGNYRIRVVSTNPALIGTDNGTDLQVIPFDVYIAPADTQTLAPAATGNLLTVTANQNSTYSWQWTQVSGSFYTAFNPAQTGNTYVPSFNTAGIYYVVCKATNTAPDVLTSNEVVVIVDQSIGIDKTGNSFMKAYWIGNDFVVDLTSSTAQEPQLLLMTATGQVVAEQTLMSKVNRIPLSVAAGTYIFRIVDGKNVVTGKTNKQ